MRINRFGKKLPDDSTPEVVSSSYKDKDGNVKWCGDNDGFDPTFERERTYLPKGTVIIRYGDENGWYAAPVHTLYKMLALPYKIRSCEYNEYEVIEDDAVPVIPVDKGIVAIQPAWPSETGGGVQYFFPDEMKPVLYYVGRGLRRLRVNEWSPIQAEDLNHA